ncbi:LysR family transcriptional regulator [Celeribacter neptunius]|uniref:DNA-binding transcriptional regulator, LysR family n=1 Tax=Celeribacter neptunius TaxID=588602 RepID=A0A1I3LWM3_9RHOB|nr:LysR family transcriptional regulator [Celeribacter neptunius]SFI89129.1 DNA-binding transcriptional regulator, LysR family [Celeribacter neptunius]
MTDRFDAMTLFAAAAEAGSLSGAARARGIPLATVSRKISDLEQHLGTTLFQRGARGLSLTDAGQSYLTATRQILDDLQQAEDSARGAYSAPRGSLTITTPIVFGRLHMVPVISEFLGAFPEVDIRLVQTDQPVNLFEDRIDLALRIGNLPDSSLIARRLGALRLITCASPEYLAQRGTPETPEDLAGHCCITFGDLMSPERWRFGTTKDSPTVAITTRLTVNTAEAALDAARCRLGITRVLSYQAAEGIRAGELTRLLRRYEPDPWPVHLLYPNHGIVPQKLRAFLDFATPRLTQRLQALPI